MSVLLLWLEGPLQSWGADSRYGNRTTLPFPTRSGVLGLLCCAAGRGGEQREWLAHMAAFTQTVRAYARQQGGGAKPPPLLVDFQMVGSGYDDGHPWQTLMVPKTSEGKKPVGSGAKMTYRHYLQDMAFACALELPPDEARSLADALDRPVWELSLGRRQGEGGRADRARRRTRRRRRGLDAAGRPAPLRARQRIYGTASHPVSLMRG